MRSSGSCVTVSLGKYSSLEASSSACEAELASLLREVQEVVDVPIRWVISDGQHSIRKAVQAVLPDVPHQLCHFHYLREAAKPVYEADRHAKKELKKCLLKRTHEDSLAVVRCEARICVGAWCRAYPLQ